MQRLFLWLLAIFNSALFVYGKGLDDNNPIMPVIKNTLKATARECMVQVDANEDDLGYLRDDPPFPNKTACVVVCLLEKIGIVSDGKYSKNGFITAVGPLVILKKNKLEHMKNVAETCSKEIKYHEEKCELGNEIISCIYSNAPELHFKY